MTNMSKMPYPMPKKFPSNLERLGYRSYNWIENRTWPIRPHLFVGFTLIGSAAQLRDFADVTIESVLKSLMISTVSTYSATFILRKFLKYFYFSYKAYLFENPKKPSIRTKLWGILRMILLKLAPPKLNSCDYLLPNLPLPALKNTVDQYIESMKYILTEEEHDQLVKDADNFLSNEGKTLQRFAWIMHKFKDNYVTSFWEKYIYFAGRYPVLINSSVAQCTMYGESGLLQPYQIARLIYIEAIGNLALDKQVGYKPIGDGLMSTRHYKNIYNGSRIPGKEYDHFQWNKPSRHVVLVHRGTWYKVDICDEKRNIYSVDQIAKIISEAITRNDKSTGSLAKIAALTTDRRTEWCENREKFFLKNPKNKRLLEIIETAMFVMSADDQLKWDVKTSADLSAYMKDMLAGDGINRWADKTMNYAVDSTGRAGATGEHSPCDGAELDHLCENVLFADKCVMREPSKEEQFEAMKWSEKDLKTVKLAEKLDFELVEGLGNEIERCYDNHKKAIDDLHVSSVVFKDFGKGRVKKCGISPDGFVQMALQLAIYRDQEKFVLTYEPGSVRFFANTRTETLRPVTKTSCDFVKAMMDQTVSRETRRDLLRQACGAHVANCKNVMIGNGIDRHLFVLCVLAKGFGYESKFLDHYSNQKWILSTSNIPNMTNQVDEDNDEKYIMTGASFGAVAQDGYGVCYRFGGNRAILVHVTSYHSSEKTDSDRFMGYLREAFHSLADLFETETNNNK
ncbi:unnamed protein product [Caenorhabditis angaria]|uniref:Choline/carnitine acyltransferase domain-containing protein n=1 Tax=Caenorhabditis angaria TaxID=860376 RepID=A0A9P1IUT0_9PELO|nr:unnamed protein product [Caenorhabditis angaria]